MTSTPTTSTSTSTPRTRREALVDRLRGGQRYGVVAGGQGEEWLQPLATLVRDFALEGDLAAVVDRAERALEPVAGELLRTGVAVTPLAWVDALAVGESAEDDEAPAVPAAAALQAPAVSVPGILLTQLAGLGALRRQGLDVTTTPPVATAGHSQGVLALEALAGADPADLYAYARLAGAASHVVGRRRGLLGATMLSVTGESPERVAAALADLPASAEVVAHLRNGRRAVVLSGPADGLRRAAALMDQVAAAEKEERARKTTGGAAFAPVVEPVAAQLAFHHPALAEAADLAAAWAEACGLDADRARDLTRRAVVEPVDWVADVERVLDAGAEWILDVGPGDLAARLTASEAKVRGAGVVSIATRRGHRELTVPGAAPRRARPWASYAPTAATLPDGSLRVETAFTRLTGRSPVLLAGMTPTTVDAGIVAAAANAGYWAELAGGGQVSEPIFAQRMAELDALLDEGRTFQFNSLFLDPYLWKLQLGGQRLVQKARAAGSAIDAVIVTAGVPELDEAVALVEELAEAGIEHVVFKPGTVAQIRQVLAIAEKVAPRPVIVQIEGGKAGGHHSWEDLDDLLVATYAQLRAHDNVVVCVGGGIGTPDVAAAYLTGEWARAHGHPVMPLDGVLVGTAAMATLEATTSPEVKQLLVDTPGTPDWVGAGHASGGMASGRSQLGADIHEIDNTASRTGRLLDEVAGDAEAVAARRDEIVEALDRTAKPYFGDAAAMTYGAWLDRFAALTTDHVAPTGRDDDGGSAWLDVTLRDRFHAMLQRAEARLAPEDHGPVATSFAAPADVEDATTALATLRETYPAADDVVLHPADVPFFVQVCRRPGKPVPFVPVVDADVRRWWRSDSLWQAHDPRFGADQVCVIPGTVSVAGITRVDEPVADLLRRFEDAAVDAVLAAGGAPLAVEGLRRADGATGAVSLVLASPDAVWAGRTVRNPVHRLGAPGSASSGWVIVAPERAEHPETGAVLTGSGDVAELSVPLDRAGRVLTLRLEVTDAVASGGVPVVSTSTAAAAMLDLLTAAAGGSLPTVADGTASLAVTWSEDLVADHAGVTGGESADFVPDALVGAAWPAVFAVIGAARAHEVDGSSGVPVVEGMLDLVHLDHAVDVARVPADGDALEVGATLRSVEETELGRVVTVQVDVRAASGDVATLVERFCVRGRPGSADAGEPARAGGRLDGADVHPTPRRTRAEATLSAPSDLRAFATVSGDHNPIHLYPVTAKALGFPRQIAHGMWSLGRCVAALENRLPEAVTVDVAFKKPILLPGKVAFGSERYDAGYLFSLTDPRSSAPHLVGRAAAH